MTIRNAASPSSSPARRRSAGRVAMQTLCALALFGLAGPAAHAADDQVYIDYRQTVMSGVGAHMGGISDILKNGLPLTANIEHHASALAESSKLIAAAFEKKVVAGPTDAKPEIWQQREKFDEGIAKMQSEAEALAATVREGRMDELGARVKALGKSCGGCHETFRKPKEESYKNK